MKVNEGNSELLEYSKRLDKRLINEIQKKESEIKSLDDLYERKISDTKTIGEDKYIGALKRNDDLLQQNAKEYEEKLNSYKENLSKTQSSLAREEQALKDNQQASLDNIREQSTNNIQGQFRNAVENQEAANAQVKNSLRTLSTKSFNEKNHLQSTARNEAMAMAGEYNNRAAKEEREFRAQLNENIRMHRDELKIQQDDLKKTAETNTSANKRIVDEKVNVQKEELKYLDEHHKDILNQKQTDFKVRYENLVKEHNTLMSDLKTHLETDVKKMVEDSATQKRTISSKSEDSFYRVETLNPKIVENEKEYFVSLSVPEHEKENVHLSVKGRGVKMTLTRKFSDTFEDKEMNVNRSTRNELYSREFPSKDLLNPKLVDQKYENGALTFRIQKL